MFEHAQPDFLQGWRFTIPEVFVYSRQVEEHEDFSPIVILFSKHAIIAWHRVHWSLWAFLQRNASAALIELDQLYNLL